MIEHPTGGAFSEEKIDAIVADSFPASDPPSWTLGREYQPSSERVDDSSGARHEIDKESYI